MAGFFAHGTTVTVDSIPIGGLLDVPIPERDREEVETTAHDSDFNREYVPGLIDNGTYELPMRLIPDDPGQDRLRDAVGNPDDIFEVVVTTPEREGMPQVFWTFMAWCKTFGGELPWENTAASRNVVLRITGAVTEGAIS
jgi:hypothetical protein